MYNSLSEKYEESLENILALKGFNGNFSTDVAVKGIKQYFEAHAKRKLFNVGNLDDKLLLTKSVHMVSAFALGLLFVDYFKENLVNIAEMNASNAFDKYSDKDSKYQYFWFLCCLSHDILSEYEKRDETCDGLEDFLQAQEITYTIYNQEPLSKYGLNPFIRTYPQSVVQSYFEKRLKQGKNDHGILGGYYFFDKLVKNHIGVYESKEKKSDSQSFYTFEKENTLYWHPDQMWIMAYVADAIIVHNIWHGYYYEKELKYITFENEEEILLDINKHPLAFLLGLVDAIEPLKRFGKLSYEEVLKNIFIVCDTVNKKICISWTDTLKGYSEFFDWIKNIYSLREWMNVKVSACRKEGELCCIEISLN